MSLSSQEQIASSKCVMDEPRQPPVASPKAATSIARLPSLTSSEMPAQWSAVICATAARWSFTYETMPSSDDVTPHLAKSAARSGSHWLRGASDGNATFSRSLNGFT